jgi:hypothetical protein
MRLGIFKKASRSFLKKRTKKLSILAPAEISRPWPQTWQRRKEQKSFASFLQKRRPFFLWRRNPYTAMA